MRQCSQDKCIESEGFHDIVQLELALLTGWGNGTSLHDVALNEISGTPGPQKNRPRNTMSLHWYIPVILRSYMHCIMHIMTEIYHSRSLVCSGTVHLGTRFPRKFVRGHIVSGRPITPLLTVRTKFHKKSTWIIFTMGWRDVPKRCVPVWMFWDLWSPKWSSLVTQCPWIDIYLPLCILQNI